MSDTAMTGDDAKVRLCQRCHENPLPAGRRVCDDCKAGDEASNAYLLALELRKAEYGRMRWVQKWNQWVFYRRSWGVWEKEKGDGAFSAARQICGPTAKTTKVLAVVREAKSLMAATPEQFDTHPWLLCVGNGVVDLRDGSFGPHSPDLMLTMRTPTSWDSAAECPTWERHLRIMTRVGRELDSPADEELVDFLQRAVGVSIIGEVHEHVIVMLLGEGGNGKGTFFRALKEALGGYVEPGPHSLLFAKEDAHPTGLKDLIGRRLVYFEEVQSGKDLMVSRLKMLSGGDAIKARGMFQDFDEGAPPTHTMWTSSNSKPDMAGDISEGLWRRLRPVQTGPRLPNEDKTWESRLKAEAPGILRWAVEGCLRWQAEGRQLQPTENMKTLLREYRQEENPFAAWAEEELEFVQDESETSRNLYDAYKRWWELHGDERKPKKDKALGDWLRNKGCERTQIGTERARGWKGVRLTETARQRAATRW